MALTRPRAHQLSGVSAKSAVRALSSSNITLSGGTPATVDGVSLTIDDRVLVTGQTSASENGIYRCTVVGSGSNGTWVRSRDANQADSIVAGMTCTVTEGTTHADTFWKLTTDGAITLGTTDLTFEKHTEVVYGPPGGSDTHVQFNDGGAYGGDAGLVYNKTTDTLTGVNITATGNVSLGDSNYINIGAGPDLSIYHDGTDSYIDDVGTGSIFLRSGTTYFQNAAGTKTSLSTNSGAGQSIYFNNSLKFVTTDTGVEITGDLENGQSDGVGNIGSSTVGFNTIHATATSAQYADLAERYITDKTYEAGTVVVIGGELEVTECSTANDHAVLGIISTDPAVKMNQKIQGQDIALTGRVPCKVVGTVNRGDLLVTSATPGHAEAQQGEYIPGTIIGKALDSKTTEDAGTIEVAVGRF